jgi:hypothetical protein
MKDTKSHEGTTKKDVAALFDCYLRLLSKHKDEREYVVEGRIGYDYLKKHLRLFPPRD